MSNPERSVEEIVEECMRSWSLCDLQYNSEYDRVEKELTQTIQAERQKREEMVAHILDLAPGFENTKTGEVTYDVGVMEWQARIQALAESDNK